METGKRKEMDLCCEDLPKSLFYSQFVEFHIVLLLLFHAALKKIKDFYFYFVKLFCLIADVTR